MNVEDFYKSLDRNVFKYFVRQGSYFVYGDEAEYLKMNNVEENVLEKTIRDVLPRMKVEEYDLNDFKLKKEGYPGNWKDFTDIMLDKAIPPSICSVQFEGSTGTLAFLCTGDNTVYQCKFEDDEVFSNLHGILREINAFELISSLDVDFGILSHRGPRKSTALDALKDFLKIDTPTVKEYVRPSVCRVDYESLDLLSIPFGTVTAQGHRLLQQFIKQPLRSREEIEHRLDLVEKMPEMDILKEFPDLLRLTKRIQNNKVTTEELVRLYQVLGKIPLLLERVKGLDDFYHPLLSISTSLDSIRLRIKETVDLDTLRVYGSQFEGCLKKVQEKIKEEHDRVLKIYEKIKYDQSAFRVTRSEYRLVEEKFKANHFLVLNFLKTGVSFTTKTLSELNMEKEEILEKIRKEEKEALDTLKDFVREKCPEIEVLNYIVALLDVFHFFSLKSQTPGYSRPVFMHQDNLTIQGLFHPLVENYITNDLSLSKDRMVVLTGPNMGGKSTFLKSLAIISVFAQMGCYVPASYASLPIYDGIYVRMGASDCSYTGDSTFMLEMKDISRIVRNATKSSLVLIDELGRGTSEVDGLSIALSVKDYLLDTNCITLFATHFPQLCDDRVVKKKVDYDGVLLLYKIVDGICNKSFGINVARRVGFPEKVLKEIEK